MPKVSKRLENFSKSGKPEDYKMACTELSASIVLKNKLNQLKSRKTQHNWHETKTVKEIIQGE